jgi:hypothetical protein
MCTLVRKEGLREIVCVRKVLARCPGSYWCMPHADICEQKCMQSYELADAHKKRSEISAQPRFFGLVARTTTKSGLRRACNMEVFALVSNSML